MIVVILWEDGGFTTKKWDVRWYIWAITADLARRKASLANKDWGLSSEMVDFNHKNNVHIFWVHYLVGGLEHDFYFPFHIWDVILPIEKNIFQRGRYTTNQLYTKMAVVSPAEALKWVRQSANPKSFFRWRTIFVWLSDTLWL